MERNRGSKQELNKDLTKDMMKRGAETGIFLGTATILTLVDDKGYDLIQSIASGIVGVSIASDIAHHKLKRREASKSEK